MNSKNNLRNLLLLLLTYFVSSNANKTHENIILYESNGQKLTLEKKPSLT